MKKFLILGEFFICFDERPKINSRAQVTEKKLKNNQNMNSFRKCSFQEIALLVSGIQLSGSNFHKKICKPTLLWCH